MSGENNNPHYQPILDALPESLHALVIPKLKEWDAGVAERFQQLKAQIEPYKAFEPFIKNNIDPDYIEKAVYLADAVQRDPKFVVEKLNEQGKLGFLTPEQAAELQKGSSVDEDEDDFLGETDVLKNPVVKQMKEALDNMQSQFERQRTLEEEEEALEQFEADLDALEEKYKDQPFHRMFVTGLINAGFDPDEAVKEYQKVIAGGVEIPSTPQSTPSTPDAPPVMGGDGSEGAGTPTTPVNFGKMKQSELNQTVVALIEAQQQSGQ